MAHGSPARLIDPSGRAVPVARIGLRRRKLSDLYHVLLRAPWPLLLLTIVGLYFTANLIFALGYALQPGSLENARPGSFADAFFFSIQTMATVGYGKMSPHTLFANLLVTIETLTGLVGFAVVTGLVFAKFSRPTARVLFSGVAVVGVRDGVPSLMFRMANERGNQIVEAQLRLVLARNEVTREGESIRRFYDLELARDRNAIFILTWTALHPITERSPLHGATIESLRASETELIVSLMGIDETFSQTIHARHSYTHTEIVWRARFVDILSRAPDGRRAIDYSKFHDTQPLDSPPQPLDSPPQPLASPRGSAA